MTETCIPLSNKPYNNFLKQAKENINTFLPIIIYAPAGVKYFAASAMKKHYALLEKCSS